MIFLRFCQWMSQRGIFTTNAMMLAYHRKVFLQEVSRASNNTKATNKLHRIPFLTTIFMMYNYNQHSLHTLNTPKSLITYSSLSHITGI